MTKVALQTSAGGVVVHDDRVLLIRTRTLRGQSVWTFPKGRVEPGERTWEAALREVREETGYLCRLQRTLRATTYWFRRGPLRIKKTVHWFLLEPVRQAGTHQVEEVDEVLWVPLPEAYDMLSYRSDRGLLQWAEALLVGGGDAAAPSDEDAGPDPRAGG